MKPLRYAIGIDVGVASLGVALVELDSSDRPVGLVDGIAYVYQAPTGGADWRRQKAMRRGYGRHRKRLKSLRRRLIDLFSLPADFDNPQPKTGGKVTSTSRVRLRALGMDQRLETDDLGRAVMHIARNRGMRLKRVQTDADGSEEAKTRKREAKKSALLARRTREMLAGRTVGQFLFEREEMSLPTRRRVGHASDFTITRDMVEAELDRLLEQQANWHAQLTPAVRAELAADVFHEEPPRPPTVGICVYGERDAAGDYEKRLPIASDLFQEKRIYEETNNLRLLWPDRSRHPLSLVQRDAVVAHLMTGQDLTPAQARKLLEVTGKGVKVTLEGASRKSGKGADRTLEGHAVRAALAGTPLEPIYESLSGQARTSFIDRMRTDDDLAGMVAWIVRNHGLAEQEAETALLGISLPAGYSKAGPTATTRLLAALKSDIIDNRTAEDRAGLQHLVGRVERADRLPYYARVFPHLVRGATGLPHDPLEVQFGRIPNPVVHSSFNRIRKVVNGFVKAYGPPSRIVVELSREMSKTEEERVQAEKENARARKKNEEYDSIIVKHGKRPTRKNRRKLRLAEMQDWKCPYTGEQFSCESLFDGTVDIDHILPRSVTLDDSLKNLVVAYETANKYKADRPPYTAFSAGYAGRTYPQIVEQVEKHTPWKAWRFGPDAMKRYEDQDEFRKRFESDNRYIAKWALQYLSVLSDDVVALNGWITSELRHRWGLTGLVEDIQAEEDGLPVASLDEDGSPLDPPSEVAATNQHDTGDAKKRGKKHRTDHRHHLVDAIVAACTPRSAVQALQTLSGLTLRREDGRFMTRDERLSLFRKQLLPIGPGFREEVRKLLTAGRTDPDRSRVAHRRNHAVDGRLHRATGYAVLARTPEPDGRYVARRRVALTTANFTTGADIESIAVRKTVGEALREAALSGEVWWGRGNTGETLREIEKDLQSVRAALLALLDAAPTKKTVPVRGKRADGDPAEEERAMTEQDKVGWALQRYVDKTGRRHIAQYKVCSLRVLRGPLAEGKRPRTAHEGHGNNRLDYYLDGSGEPGWEVISTLDENTPGFTPKWRNDPEATLLFDLRQNDVVEMLVDPATGDGHRGLFRLVKMSLGDLNFLPLTDARPVTESPRRARIRSLGAFSARQPIKTLVDELGSVRWRSRPRNW